MLTPDARAVDVARTARLCLAFLEADRIAADVVLEEAATDPVGTAGLVLCLAEFGAALTRSVAPNDWRERLQALILQHVRADER